MLELLIKPVSGLCDLRCCYCFYRDLRARAADPQNLRMDDETLESLIRRAFHEEDACVSFAFQGGEPTLAGLDFFWRFSELEALYRPENVAVQHLLQTNGFGLSAEWVSYLKKEKFLVGISLDGKENMHDVNRKDPSGRGSYARVTKTCRLLAEEKIPFNILCVVSRENVGSPREIYTHFRECGFDYLQFIPCLNPLQKNSGHAPDARAYGDFLSQIFDLWYADLAAGHAVHIRQFESIVDQMLGYAPHLCGSLGICSVQNVIEANGDVYPCDFYVLPAYRLGNVKSDSFTRMRTSAVAREFSEGSRPVPAECRRCPLYPICRNGCRRYRDNHGKNTLCEGYKRFFVHAAPALGDLAERVRRSMQKKS